MEKIGQENSNEHKLQNLQDKFKQFPELTAEEKVKFLEETQVLFKENINWLLLIREFSNFENLFVEKKPVVKKNKFDVFLIQIYLQLRKQLEIKENNESEQSYKEQQWVKIINEKNQQSGIICYMRKNQVFYKIILNDTVQSDTQIAQVNYQQWNFIGIDHEPYKMMGSQTLRVQVNLEKRVNFSTKFPNISVNNKISDLVVGQNLSGKIGSLIIFKYSNFQKMEDINKQCQLGIISQKHIDQLGYFVNEKDFHNKIFFLLSPIRCNKREVQDVFSNFKGKFVGLSGFHVKNDQDFNIVSCGGLQGLLPLTYLIRFVQKEGSEDVVNQLVINFFEILGCVLDNNKSGQTQAVKMGFFKQLSNLLNEIYMFEKLNSDIWKCIVSFQKKIVYPILTEQFVSDFLWSLKAVHNLNNEILIKEQDLIVMILKGTIRKIQIESEDLIEDILQLLLGANHKGSLCFLKFCMVSLVSFVNCLPVEFQKKYCTILVQNNALYSFLHILQNSPCLFIKSQAVQMINLFVKNFGSLGISEQDICSFIKESIWLVIQYNESSELKKSILQVKNKVQKEKKEQEQVQQQQQEQIKNEQQQLQEQIKNENQTQNDSETALVLPKKKGKKTIQLDSNLFPNFDQPEPKQDQKNPQNFGGNAPVPPTIRKKKPQGFGGFQLDMDENQMSGQSQDPGVKVFVPPKVPTGKKGGFSFGDHTIPRQSEQTSKNKISFQFPAVGKEKNGGFLENEQNQQNQQDFSGKQFNFEGGKYPRKNLGILDKKGFSINVVDEDEIQEHENEQESGKKNEVNEENQDQQFQEFQQDQEKKEEQEQEVQLKFQLPNKKFGKKKPIQFPAQMEIQIDDNDQVQENDQNEQVNQNNQSNNQQDLDQIKLENNQDQYNMEEPQNQQQFQLPNNQKKEKKIPAFKKKFLKQQGLNIDTEQINSLYLYGGEQGAKIITKEDIEKDEQEIRELANLCVKYMNGEIELEQQDFYAQKMPDLSLRDKFMKQNEEKQQKMDQQYNQSLNQVQEIEKEEKQLQQEEKIQLQQYDNQNQDYNQDLDINLKDKQDLEQEKDEEVQIDMNFKPKFGKNKSSFKSKKPISLQNNFMDNENQDQYQYQNQNQDQDKNKNNQQMEIENENKNNNNKNLEDIENNQDIQEQEKQVLDEEIISGEQEQENYKNINNDQNFNYYKDQWDIFYNSIMQWALDKNIMQSQLQQGLILDDSDKIKSKYPFFIISTLFDIAPLSMKTKIIQDLNIITKENQVNAYIISNNTEQYFWLLNVILDNIIYLEFVDKSSVSHQIILDQTLKINLNLMKQEMINNQVGDHIIDKIFKFIRIKQEELKNDKYNVLLENGLKILIQKIWGNFLVTLKPIMNKSRPTLSSIFWQNLLRYFLSTLFLLCTQLDFNKKQKSIQIQQLHISLMPYMEKEDISICQQFLEILKTLSADYLFNQKVSVKVELQKIENLLKFNQSSEFLKDFQIFQHKILNQISVLQIVNLVLVTNVDQNINLFEQELQQKEKKNENFQDQSVEEKGLQQYFEQIEKNLNSLETFLKFYLTVCENSRDLSMYNQQKKEVFANITYIINYLYLKKIEFENKVQEVANKNENENNLELLNIKEKNEKIYQLFRKSLIEIFRFIFEMVYVINQQYGNFDTFIQNQSNLENILNFESQNSSLNFNLYEFFQLLQSSFNQNYQGEFITMKIINDCQNQEYENLGDILFADKFQEFFSDSIQMIPIISVSYSYDFIQKIFRVQQKGIDNPFYQFQIENQMNMKGKIESQKKIEDNIYVQVSKIYENLDIQKQKMQLVQEENLRIQLFLYEGLEVKQNNLCMMNHKIQKHQQLIKEWGLQQIIEIQQRRYILQWTAVELFLVDGSSIFINFTDGQKKCKAFCDKLISLRKQIAFNLKYMDTLEPSKLVQKLELTKKWKDFMISNFEYLMKINQISGRTNHDISQYPVFPWIVADYLSNKHPMEKLAYSSYEEIQEIQKMEGKKFVRNLSNPIGVEGDPGRLQNYLDKFSMDGSQYDPNFKPFYYGSHYSSSAVIFQFLIRISPYTQGAILLQNGKFDLPDRMFFCVQESWNCCQREASDVRELIPEFYYLPEMYINQENYDFGEQQTGLRVHNVILPEYSQKNPYKFVCDMRQFMESNYTSNNINNWIDLIFGYKQQGKAAIDSINVFYYLTYEDNINMDNVDEDEKESIITQIQNFGQIPHQIFQKEHIQRNMIGLFKTAVDKEIKLKLFRHSANVVGNTLNRNEFLVYSNLPEKSLIKMLWRDDKKIVTLSKNWQVKEFDWLHQAQVTSQDQVIPFTMILSKQGKINLDLNKQFVEIDHCLSNLNAPICFLNKSKVIVLGGIWGGKLKIIFQEKSLIYDIQTNHKSVITCIRNDHKGNFLITGSRSGEVILWRIIPEYKLMQLQIYYDHKEEITDINYNEEMKCFATCSLDGSINIYNIYNGKHLRSLYHPQGLPIYNQR
ncbi:WD40-repeat-containing domain [Pseudocohnilembus persalinus]|uniref:WD40-repeat-containing domain n=1 Tax=Pseudocohnilembus persalinus TaxID=266149 RepID=A0A0V0QWF1_PSEPJ|nr:WD40-repeat-containing domain [Pseudocohnilembus persalinus]|eukprot:KRX06583.1 WD40-repeat-containing domain [Pseudocohnilembus persalinus]